MNGNSIAMAVVGAALWVIAAYMIYSGLAMPTTLPSDYAPQGFEGVVNLQLMHIQAMNLHLGIGAGIAGTLLICTSMLIRRHD
jgi:hypothetical protein